MLFATQNQLNSLEIHKKIKEEPLMTTAHYFVKIHLNQVFKYSASVLAVSFFFSKKQKAA